MSPNWQYIYIYHLYTTYSPCQLGDYMLPIPPIKGTRFHSIDTPGHGMAALGRKSSSGARGPSLSQFGSLGARCGDQNLFFPAK